MLKLDTWWITVHAVALLGWAALFASPWIGRRRAVLTARWAAVPLCLLYLLFLTTHLKAIPTAFDKPVLLLAGWIHYLVVDLWVGTWEAEHSEAAGIPKALLLLCLFTTFMIGPLGLLLYLAVVASRRRKAAPAA